MPEIRHAKLADLTLDAHNPNKGTERGSYMVEHSLQQYGAGRSILVDKHGRVISGNKTLEGAAAVGLEDVLIVPTDGTKLVAVQRTDLDLEEDSEARGLSFADNRASEVGLEWDPAEIQRALDVEVDLSGLWFENELCRLLGNLPEPDDPREHWKDMPAFDQGDERPDSSIIVHFQNEEDRLAFLALVGEKPGRQKSIWYPSRPYLKQST